MAALNLWAELYVHLFLVDEFPDGNFCDAHSSPWIDDITFPILFTNFCGVVVVWNVGIGIERVECMKF